MMFPALTISYKLCHLQYMKVNKPDDYSKDWHLPMGILKALIASTFTWEVLPNIFRSTRWNCNSNFL